MERQSCLQRVQQSDHLTLGVWRLDSSMLNCRPRQHCCGLRLQGIFLPTIGYDRRQGKKDRRTEEIMLRFSCDGTVVLECLPNIRARRQTRRVEVLDHSFQHRHEAWHRNREVISTDGTKTLLQNGG